MIKISTVSLLAIVLLVAHPQTQGSTEQFGATVHAPLPGRLGDLWFVPTDAERRSRRSAPYQALSDAVAAFGAGDYARAMTLVNTPALARGDVGDWAAYYRGMSELRLTKAADARATFAALRAKNVRGYLSVAGALGEAEAAEALGDYPAAISLYEPLAADKGLVNEEILLKLGRAALAAGDRRRAAQAFGRVYYEYPLTDAAIEAATSLPPLQDVVQRTDYKADLARAAALFGARRYSDARTAYAALQAEAIGEDREIVMLRIAESDYFLQKHKAAMDGLEPWLERASRKAEARFFYLSALRELGRGDEYVSQTRALVAEFPESSWSEEALNNLGTYYILDNRDDLAAEVFTDLYQRFPAGTRAERAAWKAGWWRYKNGDYADSIRIFEAAVRSFPRSDYRPSFLYWAGRAHAAVGAATEAESRLRVVYADYGSSYYGRLALLKLPAQVRNTASAMALPATSETAVQVSPPATIGVIRALLATGLYDDAINELRFAQRAWGSSRPLEATIAWAYNQKGELRRAITLMRRAYPQHLTAGGSQELPVEILQVIYPLTYWEAIRKHSVARKLDPYLVAALIAQESTFDTRIKSAANAWGLMQVVPATGRRLARPLGIRKFKTSMLTDPDVNIRMGTLYFSRLIEQFGGTHFALASYNAGENRVVRWKAERPGVEQDEFIDDIPFPETQNYVKRIIGTAEDYRALYSKNGGGRPIPVVATNARSGW